MRVVLELEGFNFDPSLAPAFFVKIRSHLKEDDVATISLPLFWVNQEADTGAKKGAYRCRVDPAIVLHTQVVASEIKRAARFLAARFARLPLHREEPPPFSSRRKAVAKVAVAPPLVTLMPDQVESKHSLVRYGLSGWVCVVCRKSAKSDAAGHKLARSSCTSIFPFVHLASDPVHAPTVVEDVDNASECFFCLSELI